LAVKEIFAESMFIDSGAHGLYNLEVLKHGKRKGKTGRDLAKPPVKWSQGDFSYYDLKPGSEFRAYCEYYAKWIKWVQSKPGGKEVIFANVDAISNPQLTWEIQKFFELELGVMPVPIVHYGTPMKYVDLYLADGSYTLLGVGGLGQGVNRHQYFGWADVFFKHICPESNDYKPFIRTHGFAMTSYELMCRYPWWSVDSATWVKLSAYGWLYVPRCRMDGGATLEWLLDRPPIMVNVSHRSPQKMVNGKHYDYGRTNPAVRELVDAWLEHCGLVMGSVKMVNGEEEVEVFGVSSHHRARSISNLTYLKLLEMSRPEWPHPLDPSVIKGNVVKGRKGFGI
jgi:hypothetical protein